jgi:hypothetical protein
MIWDGVLPDSSPETQHSGKFPRLEHVIANGYRRTGCRAGAPFMLSILRADSWSDERRRPENGP